MKYLHPWSSCWALPPALATAEQLQGGERDLWEQVLILSRRQGQNISKLGWLEWSLPL